MCIIFRYASTHSSICLNASAVTATFWALSKITGLISLTVITSTFGIFLTDKNRLMSISSVIIRTLLNENSLKNFAISFISKHIKKIDNILYQYRNKPLRKFYDNTLILNIIKEFQLEEILKLREAYSWFLNFHSLKIKGQWDLLSFLILEMYFLTIVKNINLTAISHQ